jgi:arylsulfatase A-like enzyme
VFLWLHVFDAHAPYEPPGHEKSGQRDDKKNEGDAVAVDDDGKARIPPWAGPDCDVACIRDLYSGEISFVDQQLARLFADPRVANAVIAFTGDHGEVLGTHGIYWAHKALYPDTLHVPLILAWPGAPAGERVAAPAMNIDLGRTLLDLASLRDVQFPGRDLVSALRAGKLDDAPRFGLEGRAHSASITWKGWHLLLQLEQLPEHERHENKALHQVELYKLADDPECEHDLIDKEFSRAKEMRGQLVKWLAGWSGERWVGAVRQDAETLRELAKLGYASESGEALGNKPLLDEHCTCPWCTRFR